MSEETETKKTESAETPAKKAAPRKRAATAKAATTKASSTKKASPRKPAAKKAEAPAQEPKSAPIPEMAAADLDEHEEAASGKEEAPSSSDEFIADLKEKDWAGYLVRGVFMLLFGFLSWLAISLCFLMAGIQFIILVLTGGPNDSVTKVIMTAGNYIADVMAYLSFKTDERPFPLGKPLPVED